eukprot:s362_g14.t1
MTGVGEGAFSFQIKAIANEAIRAFPDSRVRTLQDLEAISHLRLAVGTPLTPRSPDPSDARVQMSDHHVTLYSGRGWQTALAFVQFILTHKATKSHLSCTPELLVKFLCPIQAALPFPWKHLAPDAMTSVPKPFNAMPPRGCMHVVARLEQQFIAAKAATEADSEPTVSYSYVLFFFGGICNFQHNFEGKAIPVTSIPAKRDTEQSTCARYLHLNPDIASMNRVITVLRDVLLEVPVYFVNLVGKEDPMATLLCAQPSIFPEED